MTEPDRLELLSGPYGIDDKGAIDRRPNDWFRIDPVAMDALCKAQSENLFGINKPAKWIRYILGAETTPLS